MKLFSSIFKKPTLPADREEGYKALFDFLINEISVPRQAEELIANGKKAEGKPVDELLSEYFLFERYLTNLDPAQKYTRDSLRKAILQRFPLLAQEDYFSILFFPEIQKKQRLGLMFLQTCLQYAGDTLGGTGGDSCLEQLQKELEWLQLLLATPGSLQHIQNFAHVAYGQLTVHFNERVAENVFNHAYQETARYYKQLESFSYLISILPRNMVGYAQLNLLTQAQVEQIFLEKLTETEKLNWQLSQKIREAEEAQNLARKNEVLLRSIIASSLDGMVTLDDEGAILNWNPAAEEIFGYRAEEALGKSLTDLIVPPEYREGHRNGFSRFLKTHQSNIMNRRLEMTGLSKDGRRLPVEVTITAAHHNNRYYFNGFIRDISDRVQKEKELLQTREKAEMAAKAKADFLSVMSHEIRTPLHAIIGFSHLLLDDAPRQDQMEFLNSLKFSGETLLHIINDILDFNKLDSGKLELGQEDYSLHELLDNIYKTFLPKSKEKNIALVLAYDNRLPRYIRGDPGRMSQVINNLVSNAIKFTHEGQVVIRVRLADNEKPGLLQLDFSVEDTGIGIPYEKQQKIFDLFTQADSNTTRKYGGTGLGLSIAHKIVQLMGSDIKLESTPSEGSAFYFRLAVPVATVNPPPQREAPVPEERNNSIFEGKKILLAEDNPINILVAKQFVQNWGGEVAVAMNGEEALEMYLENVHFDIVLMDLQMPVMDGFTSSKEIRKHNATIPIIALTASSIEDVQASIVESGMNDYLNKPFVPEKLFEVLRRYL